MNKTLLFIAAVLTLSIFSFSASAESASLKMTAPENAAAGEKISAVVQLDCDEPLLSVQFDFSASDGARAASAKVLCGGVIESKISGETAKLIVISDDVMIGGDDIAEISITLPKSAGEYSLSINNAVGVNEKYETVTLGGSENLVCIESTETQQTTERTAGRVQTQTSSAKTRSTSAGTVSRSTRSTVKSSSSKTESRGRNNSRRSSDTEEARSDDEDDDENSDETVQNVSIIYPDRIAENYKQSDERTILIYGGIILGSLYIVKRRKEIVRKILDHHFNKKYGDKKTTDEKENNDDEF